jgi:hypothetical protein
MIPTRRICSDCGEAKDLADFTRIKACVEGWYGRCRACRAKRARERYWADPEEREIQRNASDVIAFGDDWQAKRTPLTSA